MPSACLLNILTAFLLASIQATAFNPNVLAGHTSHVRHGQATLPAWPTLCQGFYNSDCSAYLVPVMGISDAATPRADGTGHSSAADVVSMPKRGESEAMRNVSAMLCPDFWEELAHRQNMHVFGQPLHPSSGNRHSEGLAAAPLREQMRVDGYGQMTHEQWSAGSAYSDTVLGIESIGRLASLVNELVKRGLPAQFLLCYDEAWRVISRVSATLSPVFHLRQIHDFFVFHVPQGKAGWPVHRDRSGDDAKLSFTEDDLPMYTTVWVALTDATPPQSGMYIIPAYADPDYRNTSTLDDADHADILVQRHQDIRAIPAARGTVLFWSHRALHWGSISSPAAPEPRVALTWAMADPEFEKSLLRIEGDDATIPCFEARLALIACTLLGYHHSAQVPDEYLLSVLCMLSEFSVHLSDVALAPANSENFQRNLVNIGLEASKRDADQGQAILDQLSKIANYILVERGLPSVTWGFDDLAGGFSDFSDLDEFF